MDYYSQVGHYLLYPIAVLAMSSIFFYLGLKAGRKRERKRIAQLNRVDHR